jgi:hypothetical protein
LFAEKCTLESLEEGWLVAQSLRSDKPVFHWHGGTSKLSGIPVSDRCFAQCHGTYIIEVVVAEQGELTAEVEAALCSLKFTKNNREVGATGVRDCGKVVYPRNFSIRHREYNSQTSSLVAGQRKRICNLANTAHRAGWRFT